LLNSLIFKWVVLIGFKGCQMLSLKVSDDMETISIASKITADLSNSFTVHKPVKKTKDFYTCF